MGQIFYFNDQYEESLTLNILIGDRGFRSVILRARNDNMALPMHALARVFRDCSDRQDEKYTRMQCVVRSRSSREHLFIPVAIVETGRIAQKK